jgi:hypothetical protein
MTHRERIKILKELKKWPAHENRNGVLFVYI